MNGQIVDLYRAGVSVLRIASAFGITPGDVRSTLRQRGILIGEPPQSQREPVRGALAGAFA